MENFPNNECFRLCTLCGGECCKTKPGIEAPERFVRGSSVETLLTEALSSGLWVLDRHRGVPTAAETKPDERDRFITIWYPRPATIRERSEGALFGSGEAGACVFLTESGCRLSFADRPLMCSALEPDVAFECSSSWTRLDAALAWLPFRQQVINVLKGLPQAEAELLSL